MGSSKGMTTMNETMRAALLEAAVKAINHVGLTDFKKTSLFLSNSRAAFSEEKAAA